MRIARRITLSLASLLVLLGTVGATTGTAFAAGPGPVPVATPDTSIPANFYMYWDAEGQPGPVMWQDYPNSSSNVYAPTADDPWNWYSCYIADCDGLVADQTGVHLLSSEKGNGNLATDHRIIDGYYGYSYTASDGTTLYLSGSWNGQKALPWTKQFYSAQTGQWLTLTLSYASLDLNWNGQPVVPTSCDDQTISAVAFCS